MSDASTRNRAASGAVLSKAIETCRRAAQGDLEARIVGVPAGDPHAELATSVNELLDMTDAFVREAMAALEHASADQFHRRVIERGMKGSFRRASGVINTAMARMQARAQELARVRERQGELAASFEHSVMGVAERVASASTQLEASARALSSSADDTVTRSGKALGAARQASDTSALMATATNELDASICEIAAQVHDARRASSDGVKAASGTAASVGELQKATAKIGDVVRVITDIASQTKLLALNATIEAARAGEAGRGFSVVASEVKSLASQTTSATDSVEAQITAVQRGTEHTASATRVIGGSVKRIDEISQAIAAAIEQQKTATSEISKHVGLVASSTDHAATQAKAISEAARVTTQAAEEVLRASSDLSTLAETLHLEATQFLRAIRA